MTKLEKVHDLIEEDKDSLVGSYLSLLAFINNHQKLKENESEDFLKEITDLVHRHIELLPENSLSIYEELSFNESERLDSVIAGRATNDDEGVQTHELPS